MQKTKTIRRICKVKKEKNHTQNIYNYKEDNYLIQTQNFIIKIVNAIIIK